MSFDTLEGKFLEADLLLKEKNFDAGIRMLNEILAEDPSYGRAHNHLGWVYETKLKDFEKAEYHYELGLKFTPEYPAIYSNFAILLSTQKRFEELVVLLEKAKEVKGIDRANIANEYGIMYESQGRYDDAIQAYREYIGLVFDEKSVDRAAASIERCKKKQELLG